MQIRRNRRLQWGSRNFHMNKTSILLALDGSDRRIKQLNWRCTLKQTNGALVTAQHVIDTRTAWRLLGAPTDGLIGSGLYIAAATKLMRILAGFR